MLVVVTNQIPICSRFSDCSVKLARIVRPSAQCCMDRDSYLEQLYQRKAVTESPEVAIGGLATGNVVTEQDTVRISRLASRLNMMLSGPRSGISRVAVAGWQVDLEVENRTLSVTFTLIHLTTGISTTIPPNEMHDCSMQVASFPPPKIPGFV